MTSSTFTAPFLVRLFKSLDTLIALHYSTNYFSSIVRLSSISKQVLNLTEETLVVIKSIYPESYHLERITDDVTIDVYSEEAEDRDRQRSLLIQNIETRQQTFKSCLDSWFDKGCPITFKLAQKTTASPRKPAKVTKPANPRLKYEFHEKKVDSDLPLLERIRLKSSMKKNASPHKRKQELLQSKLIPIYNVLYEQSPKFGAAKTINLSIARLQQLIKDSLNMPLSETEIGQVLNGLQDRLGLDVVAIGDTQVLKIPKLNRTSDLAKLAPETVSES
ncbi:hypothetical protein OGAPHI_004700 [Ogataea philodendri]|uniref:DNA replication factor Cdt1 C-terminal domain-containing protein n=1 Tax=Ogataea philodendri TaxID=1378263 RepID=A0A9P8P2T2_9ASCO|nr:uncharacterized protein OGAPHI_004700 [Ogataea philodendri]KAH3663986.1 hypothetical protein OGAPHI_004700 [Ogataea philodendri]